MLLHFVPGYLHYTCIMYGECLQVSSLSTLYYISRAIWIIRVGCNWKVARKMKRKFRIADFMNHDFNPPCLLKSFPKYMPTGEEYVRGYHIGSLINTILAHRTSLLIHNSDLIRFTSSIFVFFFQRTIRIMKQQEGNLLHKKTVTKLVKKMRMTKMTQLMIVRKQQTNMRRTGIVRAPVRNVCAALIWICRLLIWEDQVNLHVFVVSLHIGTYLILLCSFVWLYT